MGNAESDAAEADQVHRLRGLQQELSEMEHAIRALVRHPQIDVLGAQQRRVCGVIVTCQSDVRVLVGPVVGKVDAQSARVLLEVDRAATVSCHVAVFDARVDALVPVPQCNATMQCAARRPVVFLLSALQPGRRYRFAFSGVNAQDAETRTGGFYSPICASDEGMLACAVVSADNAYELEPGEPSLWRDLRTAVVDEQRVRLVLHLGGQVALQRMVDKAYSLLLQHVACVLPPITLAPDATKAFHDAWQPLEERALEILRSAYRTQWSVVQDKQCVLANAANLMLWSDWDVYPHVTTDPRLRFDHDCPTLETQVLRIVLRSALQVQREYQRALWDDDLPLRLQTDQQQRALAESALAMTARLHQLAQMIPQAQATLDQQKQRRDIEGARRAERQLRALESEKTSTQAQLTRCQHALEDPHGGDEFVVTIGDIALLFLDTRSARIDAGGAQCASNDLLNAAQWAFLEQCLERDDIAKLVVCCECPLIDHMASQVPELPEAADPDQQLGLARDPDPCRVGCDWDSLWVRHPDAQQRVLALLFTWKAQAPTERDVLLLAGACQLRAAFRSRIRDQQSDLEIEQWVAGPITAGIDAALLPAAKGVLAERFAYEHVEFERHEKSMLLAKWTTQPLREVPMWSDIARRSSAMLRESAVILVGPIVGHVGATSAVLVLELDREADVICELCDVVTHETRRVFEHFHARRPQAIELLHLLPEHAYNVSFPRLEPAQLCQASFATLPLLPSMLDIAVLRVNSQQSLVDLPDRDSLWPLLLRDQCLSAWQGPSLMIHMLDAAEADDADPSSFPGFEHAAAPNDEAQREAQRLDLAMPQQRQLLTHGAHLLLPVATQSAGRSDLEWEYANLLLPRAHRTATPRERAWHPIPLVFGTVGVFVWPSAVASIVNGHGEACWRALEAFLQTPLLSVLVLVTCVPVLEDSVEDVVEKARYDPQYQQKLAFHPRALQRLLQLLTDWQSMPAPETIATTTAVIPPASAATSSTPRQVTLVSSHGWRSFDSVLQRMHENTPRIPTSCIPQYVVGPLQQPHYGSHISRIAELVFRRGTLFTQFSYAHRFHRPEEEHAADPAGHRDHLEHLAHPQLLYLQLDAVAVSISPQFLSPHRLTHEPLLDASAFDHAPVVSITTVDPVSSTALAPWRQHHAAPLWLRDVMSRERTEHEQQAVELIEQALSSQREAIDAAYRDHALLSSGMVGIGDLDRSTFCTALQQAIADFHARCSSVAFRLQCPHCPSLFVVQESIETWRSARPSTPVGALDSADFAELVQLSFVRHAILRARLQDD